MTNFSEISDDVFKALKTSSEICRRVQDQIVIEELTKDDRSPVTVADYCSQAIICKAIREAFPDDPIIAEEGSDGLQKEEGQFLTSKILANLADTYPDLDRESVYEWIDYGNESQYSERFWTLDPIDGTKGFLRKDQYAISLALIENGEIKLGMLALPNFAKYAPGSDPDGTLFIAVKEQGAFKLPMNGDIKDAERITVTETDDISSCAFCESFESGHSNHSASQKISEALNISKPPARIDSQAKYALVSMGFADIYLRLPTKKGYREKIWDHAAGVVLVEEAGGVVTDIHGKKLDFTKGKTLEDNRGIVVSNSPENHKKLLKAIS